MWRIAIVMVLSSSALTGMAKAAGPAANVSLSLSPNTIVADGTSTTTATATVTDAQGLPVPGESVHFSGDTGQRTGNVTDNGDGTYTATITSSTTLGTATITATDGTATPGQATLTQTAGPPAKVTVTLSPGAIVADGISIATATATVTDGEGHGVPNDPVDFSSSDPGQFFGPVRPTAADGTYSVQIRGSTTVGSATITATDQHQLSSHATLTQAAGPSKMSLVATPATVVTNQQVTLLAIVQASTGSPTGTITFKRGSVPIAGCVGEPITPSSTAASCQTSFASSTSPEPLTAAFTPGSTSTAPAASGTTTVTVKPDLPALWLAVAASAQVGQSATYTAIVAPPGSRPGPVQPSGKVDFFDNGQPIPSCQGEILVNGIANCTTSYKATGSHAISTRYSGNANFAASTSAAQTIAIVPVQKHVAGIVTSTMQWLFSFTRRYTKVRALSVRRASRPISMLVTCHGGGCPFARRTVTAPTTGTVNLASSFKKPLRVGATITVLISRPAWIGKYYKFVIRARRPPRIQIDCLAPGGTRPGANCST